MRVNGMNDLTKRQRQILVYIQECQRASGVAPSMREIAEHFGFSSTRGCYESFCKVFLKRVKRLKFRGGSFSLTG